jgi:hypothetical protein
VIFGIAANVGYAGANAEFGLIVEWRLRAVCVDRHWGRIADFLLRHAAPLINEVPQKPSLSKYSNLSTMR